MNKLRDARQLFFCQNRRTKLTYINKNDKSLMCPEKLSCLPLSLRESSNLYFITRKADAGIVCLRLNFNHESWNTLSAISRHPSLGSEFWWLFEQIVQAQYSLSFSSTLLIFRNFNFSSKFRSRSISTILRKWFQGVFWH